jgi:Sodium/hydrogen exchanger family
VFAEVGVVLLMFSIGVDFSIPDLMRVKWVALGGASVGILSGISIAVCKLAGWSGTEGMVIGATLSVASTMVLARLLTDSGRLSTIYGRIMIGITLVEDLAVNLYDCGSSRVQRPQRGALGQRRVGLGESPDIACPALLPCNESHSSIVQARPLDL